jgi:hypothetical protein
MYDTCSSSEVITSASKCPSTPTPSPPAPVPKSTLPEKILAELFKLLKITDVDAATCVNDVGGAEVYLKAFAQDIAGKNFSLALDDLSRGLSSLSTSVADCGVVEVQAKIDMLAASIKWANISTAGFDKDVKIIVDASDLYNDISALAAAVSAEDPANIGTAISKLLSDWTSITGGCGANSTACKFLDGLLRMVQVVAENVAPCEAAIEPVLTNFTSGFTLFKQKDYTKAVAAIAGGMDDLAKALATDACGLEKVAAVLSEVAPKLASAIVTVENSTAVKILVNAANVYDELYKAATDLESGNIDDFGVEMGLLLAKLRATSCSSKACIVLEGVLAAFQLEATDFKVCAPDIDKAWDSTQAVFAAFEAKNFTAGLADLSTVITSMATAVKDCGATDFALILEDVATKLGAPAVATEIGAVVQVLVDGSDLTLDINKLIADGKAGSWSSVGHDLGSLSSWLAGTGCKSFVCKIVEGLLNAAAIPFQDLLACEADLKQAEADFVAGGAAMGQKKVGAALQYWASGLNHVAKSTNDCGLAAELSYMEQEANLLGFGNITALGDAAQIIIHGADFYEDVYGAFEAFETHDYRTAGSELGKVMEQLSQWTTGHACTSPVCYVVMGMMQFLGDIEGDIKNCEGDLELAWGNLSAAYGEFKSSDITLSAAQRYGGSADFAFATGSMSTSNIKAGVKDLGYALESIASGVGDCHLAQLADILAKLATELGIAPEVKWVEEVLKILIDGVEIENEIGAACIDYSENNWIGFGYNIIELIKNLL